MNKKTTYILAAFVVFAALSRLLPHAYNFTPLGAIALFGAAYFTERKWALLVPLAAVFFSDLILNNVMYAAYHDGFTWLTGGFIYLYGSIALIFILGYYLLRKVTLPRVIGGAFAASLIFFIVSNFGVWLSGQMYPLTAEGLIACYTAGIPFFHNTLAGNLIYSGVLFGGFEWIKNRYPSLQYEYVKSES